MSSAQPVVVVGGGVAGLCTAYYLRKAGAEVTILESNRIGSGASAGNGGWLCPAQAGPLPEPGLTLTGMRALVNRDSALYFKPSYLGRLAPWLMRFWSFCNAADYRRGLVAMAELGSRVFELVDAMAGEGVEFELHKQGMLLASRDPEHMRAELDKLRPMSEFGYEMPEEILLDDALHEVEPALAPEVRAGFVVPQHWHVRPETFNAGVADAARRIGVEILEAAEVHDFVVEGDAVRGVRSSAGDHDAGAVVLATGSWTSLVASKLGLRVPIEAGKGYSFLVQPSVAPRHAILLADVHVGCTPFEEGMRIGGTMEFSGVNLRLDRHRIDHTIAGARSSFREWAEPGVRSEWAGMRPIAPDGLPLVGLAGPLANVYLATGYSMQGMTLGPPAGAALADYITSGVRPAVLEPFAPERFSSNPMARRRFRANAR